MKGKMNKYLFVGLVIITCIFIFSSSYYMTNPTQRSIEKCQSYGYESAENIYPYRTYCIIGSCGVNIEDAENSNFCNQKEVRD